jgi:hypothetical protein
MSVVGAMAATSRQLRTVVAGSRLRESAATEFVRPSQARTLVPWFFPVSRPDGAKEHDSVEAQVFIEAQHIPP